MAHSVCIVDKISLDTKRSESCGWRVNGQLFGDLESLRSSSPLNRAVLRKLVRSRTKKVKLGRIEHVVIACMNRVAFAVPPDVAVAPPTLRPRSDSADAGSIVRLHEYN